MLKRFIIAITSFASATTMAGQIELNNGDKVGGSLKAINSDAVVWAADMVGELTIKKSDIKSIQENQPVKLRGTDKPCQLLDLNGDQMGVNCNGQEKTLSLLTLEDVVLFATHEQALHAYTGKLTLVGTEKSGNVDSRNWLAESQVNLRHNDFRHGFELRYVGESLEVETVAVDAQGDEVTSKQNQVTEYYKAAYGVDWFFQPRWYLLGDLTAEKDGGKKILERYIVGAGAGFQWWESVKTALKLELSMQQTKERSDISADEIADGIEASKEFASGRFAVDYRYLFPRNIALFHRSQLTQSLDESDDWFARAETGVSAPLGAGISAAFNLDYDYINNPADGVERGDTTYRVGVTYTW